MANAIYPTFEALSDQDILACHLHGGTQNQNEAINASGSMLQRKPTLGWLWYNLLAVAHFNNGTISIILILQSLGIDPGFHCIKAYQGKIITVFVILTARALNKPRKGANS